MDWQVKLIFWIPLGLTAIVFLWLLFLEIKGRVSSRLAGKLLAAVIAIYFLQITAQMVLLFFRLRGDEFGKYLLPGSGSKYFYNIYWSLGQPYLWALAVGLILILILILLRFVFRSEIVDRADLFIILMTIFAVGISNVLILILGTFFLMVFFLIGFNLRQKKVNSSARLKLTPFLLFTAIAILILSNFQFYWQFLNMLKLI